MTQLHQPSCTHVLARLYCSRGQLEPRYHGTDTLLRDPKVTLNATSFDPEPFSTARLRHAIV